MTLGQEFSAFAHTMLEDVDRLQEAQSLLREINMGATAIGTGITTPKGYAESVRAHLSRITGLDLITAPDLVEATADTGVFVQLSGVLKRCAVKLSKICNDLRLLSSGPRAGLGEINLPPMQPGSSIMPGKVNPVIPEDVNQVCFDEDENNSAEQEEAIPDHVDRATVLRMRSECRIWMRLLARGDRQRKHSHHAKRCHPPQAGIAVHSCSFDFESEREGPTSIFALVQSGKTATSLTFAVLYREGKLGSWMNHCLRIQCTVEIIAGHETLVTN